MQTHECTHSTYTYTQLIGIDYSMINNLLVFAHPNTHVYKHKKHTLTGRGTPRPFSCSLTHASTVSHQVVACVTTVGGCLSKCVPAVWLTWPLAGLGRLPQSTAVEKRDIKQTVFGISATVSWLWGQPECTWAVHVFLAEHRAMFLITIVSM